MQCVVSHLMVNVYVDCQAWWLGETCATLKSSSSSFSLGENGFAVNLFWLMVCENFVKNFSKFSRGVVD